MTLTELEKKIERYLNTCDNYESVEVYDTPKGLARTELRSFVEWLKENPL